MNVPHNNNSPHKRVLSADLSNVESVSDFVLVWISSTVYKFYNNINSDKHF